MAERGNPVTGKRREPVLLYGVLLTAAGVFLTVTGSRNGDTLRLVVGIFSLLFFGLGTVVLIAQKFGLLATPVARPVARSRAGNAVAAQKRVYSGPLPELSSEAKIALASVVETLSAHGIFVPEVPSADQLEAPAAEYGEPIVLESVLGGAFSAPFYSPDFEIARYTGNLHVHPWKIEQMSEVIEQQVTDLVGLCGGALAVDDLAIDLSQSPRVSVSATVNGESFESVYTGAGKWMSTVLIHDLATVYERLGLPTRLAAISTEPSLYLTLLRRGAIEELEQTLNLEEDPAAQLHWIDDESFRFEAGLSTQPEQGS